MAFQRNIRIIFYADTHLGFDYPIRPRIQRRRRGPDFFENHRKVLDYAVTNKADLVLHGGDLYFRSKVPQKIVDLTCMTLLDFAASGIDLVLVPGNHERSRFPVTLFLNHPRIHIFRKPETFVFEKAGCTMAISGFPFVRRHARNGFKEFLSETGWQDHPAQIRLLCLHQAIEGARVGPSNYTFRNGDEVIRMRDLPDTFTAVLSGHIHRRQVLKGKNGLSVIYPGSIERTSFAEKSEEKGFYHIELGIDAGGKGIVKALHFIPLPSRPMVDLEIDLSADGTTLRSYLSSRLARLDPNAIVRLKPGGNASEQGTDREPVWPHALLREIFPESMNFQIRGSHFRNRVGK